MSLGFWILDFFLLSFFSFSFLFTAVIDLLLGLLAVTKFLRKSHQGSQFFTMEQLGVVAGNSALSLHISGSIKPSLVKSHDIRSGRKAKARHGWHRSQWVINNTQHSISKFFTIFVSKMRLGGYFKYKQKNNIKAAIFA